MDRPRDGASADELRDWLGYSQDAAVVRWLTDRGIPFDLGAGGRPCTTWTAINARLAGRQNKAAGFSG